MPKNAGPSRKLRLESLLHREIAQCVQQDLRDPRLGFITIVRVELTADLHQVTAYYTVLGDDKQKRLAAAALEHARGFVQKAYAPVVATRMLPTLSFAIDDREERRQSMDDLIKRARKTDSDQGTVETPAAPAPPGEEPPAPPTPPAPFTKNK
jgi:ribosome-binding factor A